jgi:hypothetical protein
LLGREIDRGGSRTVGTIIGAGAGALLGREITRGDVRCRYGWGAPPHRRSPIT